MRDLETLFYLDLETIWVSDLFKSTDYFTTYYNFLRLTQDINGLSLFWVQYKETVVESTHKGRS